MVPVSSKNVAYGAAELRIRRLSQYALGRLWCSPYPHHEYVELECCACGSRPLRPRHWFGLPVLARRRPAIVPLATWSGIFVGMVFLAEIVLEYLFLPADNTV